MNLKLQMLVALGIVLGGAGSFAAIQSISHVSNKAEPASVTAEYSPSSQQAVIEALTQQIAALEVEKSLLSATFTSEAPQIMQAEAAQASLQKRLQELDADGNQAQVAAVTATALESEIAVIETQYAQDAAKFIDEHPLQAKRRSQLQYLRQSLAALEDVALKN